MQRTKEVRFKSFDGIATVAEALMLAGIWFYSVCWVETVAEATPNELTAFGGAKITSRRLRQVL